MTIDPPPVRRLGRPPKNSHGVSTEQRLLDAAFDACVELGFDGVGLTDVAARAGITANAVYNYFDSKSALLIATAKRAVESLPVTDEELDLPARARALVLTFLAPEAASARRFVAALAGAAPRHPELAHLMIEWNEESIARWPKHISGTRSGRARLKTLYFLLLGISQLDALESIDARANDVAKHVADAAAALFTP